MDKMKKILLLLILTATAIFPNGVRFVILTDTQIGTTKADSLLSTFVTEMNSLKPDFVVLLGDVTIAGKDVQFEKAKNTLSKLKMPYYVLQGYRDVQWSESGGLTFEDLWEEKNFSFTKDSLKFIGFNSTPIWKAQVGHISPETFEWLSEEIKASDGKGKIIFFSYYSPSEIDNWGKLATLLNGKQIAFAFNAQNSKDLSTNFSIPQLTVTKFFNKGKSYSATFCEIKNDTLKTLYLNIDSGKIDSTTFFLSTESFSAPADTTKIEPYDVEIAWHKNLNATMVAEPLVLENKIITAQYDGLVSCFDKSGKKLWDFDSFGNIVSQPAAKDGILAVATLQGDLFTLNLETGEQVQSIGFDEPITSALLMIDYTGNKELMIPKQSSSKAAVIFGTGKGKLYCYDVETLQQYWVNKSAKGMIQSAPLYLNNKLIYGAWDGFLYSVDAREGWLIWKWQMDNHIENSPAASKPATDGRFIYVVQPNGFVYKVDPLLGKTVWSFNKYDAWQSIGISDDEKTLFVKSRKDFFHKIPASTGSWSIAYKLNFGKDETPTTPIEYKKIIFTVAANGKVYRIKGKRHKEILFNGSAIPFSVKHFYDDIFVASNIDGVLTVFKYSEN